MKEKDFEDILEKHPDLIEPGLKPIGRQVAMYNRRMDLLFEDQHRNKLIVELKAGPIKDEHIGQILAYEGMILSAEDPAVRVMLIGTRVPLNIQKALDHHGIAWKELKITQLKEYLASVDDRELLSRITEEFDQSYSTISKNHKGIPVERNKIDGDTIGRAVARIREEYLDDPYFHSVRIEAEAEAKEMLDTILNVMSPTDIHIQRFLEYMNTENIKGKTKLTRFGGHFTNIVARQICECPDTFKEWIGTLWRAEEDDLQKVLTNFLLNAPINGAGKLLPTFVLYLRKPTAFNIWTKALGTNLANAFSVIEPHGKSQHEQYFHFNHQVFDLLVTPFRLKPQEVDLVLSQLPKYLKI